jgi:hypothetical protein
MSQALAPVFVSQQVCAAIFIAPSYLQKLHDDRPTINRIVGGMENFSETLEQPFGNSLTPWAVRNVSVTLAREHFKVSGEPGCCYQVHLCHPILRNVVVTHAVAPGQAWDGGIF